MSVPCFVINLAHNEKRRLEISRQLEQLQLPFTIFPAVNGKSLSPDELTNSYDKTRAIQEAFYDLTLGEIGCALSHIGVYRDMVRLGIEHALVLEDDANVSNAVVDILPGLAAQYPGSVPQLVLLNHVEKYKRVGMLKLNEDYRIVSPYGEIQNAHGYFITLAAAKKLSEELFPVWQVADQWRRFEKDKLIRVKALVPYCVGLSQYANDSSLTEERVAKIAFYQRGGFTYYMHRFLYKKFLRQLIRPFFRVAKQKQTW